MISRAIRKAYIDLHAKKWDTVYWAIDLHGTVFSSNYVKDDYQFINMSARGALQYISRLPETKIILWSSVPDEKWSNIVQFFNDNNIKIFDCNKNPEVQNTEVGCFDQKFYFSILVDDKAGFHPNDWDSVARQVQMLNRQFISYRGY